MRVLKNWTKDERKQLEGCKYSGHYSAFGMCYLIHDHYVQSIASGSPKCASALGDKYRNINGEAALNQLAKDIVDYFTSNAQFPEKEYYVIMINSEFPYLGQVLATGVLSWYSNKLDSPDIQKRFTMREIEAIDPRLRTFAVLVEDEDDGE